MPTSLNLIRILIVAALLWIPSLVKADEAPIGFIKTIAGNVNITTKTGSHDAAIGMAVYLGDTIMTGTNGSVGLLLSDDTSLALGPNSEMSVDTFLFNPAQAQLGLSARLVSGTLHFISGVIARLRPESVQIITPNATIGVRGTRFVVKA